MIKLTVMHLNILGPASGREDGLIKRPSNLRPAASAKVAAKLIERGLVREVRAKDDMPIWRTDEHGKAFSLKILKAGRAAAESKAEAETDIQVEPPAVAVTLNAADAHPHPDGSAIVARSAAPKKTRSLAPVAVAPPLMPSVSTARQGSKREQVIALLGRPNGASMAELIAATGWLPHTTRAALSGLRKRDLTLERFRDEALTTRYRITDAANNATIPGASNPRAAQAGAVAAKSDSSTGAAA